MFDAITAELQRMRAEPTAANFARKGLAARDAIFAGSRTANALLAELDGIAARSRSPEKPNMLAILRGGRLGASSIESLLWAALNRRPDNKLPI